MLLREILKSESRGNYRRERFKRTFKRIRRTDQFLESLAILR